MNLEEIVTVPDQDKWLVWEQSTLILVDKPPRIRRQNRETLARVFAALTEYNRSETIRVIWKEEASNGFSKSLPRIIGEDGFLRMYALGRPLSIDLVKRIWQRKNEPIQTDLNPISVEWNPTGTHFYDIDATPPGFLSKFFPFFRLKTDKELLLLIGDDLKEISKLENDERRRLLTLAVLSHAAAYRELDGYQIQIPSFQEKDKLIDYQCTQHLIAEGLKTASLTPINSQAPSIYLCQGTEFWPSQPSMLASIMANFGEHGSATEAYAHSWRRIHQQLRALNKPIVAGHSMGGALAIQIALYSHDLIETSYAFNPPVPNERDYQFYHQIGKESQKKINVIANLDDFAFWRIGAKIIGNVTVYLSKRRWKYYSVDVWDCIFLLPAFVKFMRNVHHAFPAHQRIAALYENWISFKLTQEEIETENLDRTTRFDYLHFLPKLYDPSKVLLTHVRKIFKWRLAEEYLKNEIEILALHERDLLDTLEEGSEDEIGKELEFLRTQKEALIEKLRRL